jgi:glycosyltransferase involved in cell wall biosynthesis
VRRGGIEVELEVIGGETPSGGASWYRRIDVPPGCSEYPRFAPWLRSESRRWDGAVAPLEDTPFNRCKSDLKFLEYSAMGLPGVYSDIGVYTSCVDGLNALLVENTTQAWSEALRSLCADPGLRNHLRSNAYRYVVEERCLAHGATQYLAAITSLEQS